VLNSVLSVLPLTHHVLATAENSGFMTAIDTVVFLLLWPSLQNDSHTGPLTSTVGVLSAHLTPLERAIVVDVCLSVCSSVRQKRAP